MKGHHYEDDNAGFFEDFVLPCALPDLSIDPLSPCDNMDSSPQNVVNGQYDDDLYNDFSK